MYTADNRGSVTSRVKEAVTDVARALFTPRVQKFIEAGYLTRCNDFTPEFDNAVRLIALEKWGEELEVKAAEAIEARKETK